LIIIKQILLVVMLVETVVSFYALQYDLSILGVAQVPNCKKNIQNNAL